LLLGQDMKIRNIQLKAIEARRYINRNERPKQVRIDHNSTISHISDIKEKQATIDFQYTDDAKKIANEWNDTRKMPNPVASQIHTAVMHACVPGAVGIAKDLGLPPPIPLPQVRLGTNPKQGQFGPEVA